MTEERTGYLLRQCAHQEWSDPPDVWPAVRTSVQRIRARTGRHTLPEEGFEDVQRGGRNRSAAIPRLQSWPREIAKMAAGAAVVGVVAVVLVTVFSGHPESLPGLGEDEAGDSGAALVTEGEALIIRWNDEQAEHELVAVDARTGAVSNRVPAVSLGPSGMIAPHGISADGHRIASIFADETIENPFAGGARIWPRAIRLTITDTRSGETAHHPLPEDGWVPMSVHPQFSPDGETLVLVYDRAEGSTVMLFDATTAELLVEHDLGEHISFLQFHPNGNEFVIYSQDLGSEPGISPPVPPRVAVLDAGNLEWRWNQTLDEVTSGVWCTENCDAPVQDRETASWHPGITMDHHGDYLYIAHIDQPVVERVNLSDGGVETIEYQPGESSINPGGLTEGGSGYGIARVSRDGSSLYLAIGLVADREGLLVIDLDAAEVEREYRPKTADGITGFWFVVAPDESMIITGQPLRRTSVMLDPETFDVMGALEDWRLHPATTLDGDPILLAINERSEEPLLGVVNPETMEIVDSWTGERLMQWANVPGWSWY